MKAHGLLISTLAAIAIFSGCTRGVGRQFAPQPESAKPVPPEKARVYAVWPGSMYRPVYNKNGVKVLDNGKAVGELGAHSALVWDRDPGRANINISMFSDSEGVWFDLKPGDTVYVGLEYKRECLGLSGRFVTRDLGPTTGANQVAGCRLAAPVPPQ